MFTFEPTQPAKINDCFVSPIHLEEEVRCGGEKSRISGEKNVIYNEKRVFRSIRTKQKVMNNGEAGVRES